MRYDQNSTRLSAMTCLALLLAMPVIANATEAAKPEKNGIAKAPEPAEAPPNQPKHPGPLPICSIDVSNGRKLEYQNTLEYSKTLENRRGGY